MEFFQEQLLSKFNITVFIPLYHKGQFLKSELILFLQKIYRSTYVNYFFLFHFVLRWKQCVYHTHKKITKIGMSFKFS